jgi:hypothetical protein
VDQLEQDDKGPGWAAIRFGLGRGSAGRTPIRATLKDSLYFYLLLGIEILMENTLQQLL